MNLSSLSDQDLLFQLSILQGKERQITLKILYYLIELENRKLYRNLGYASLFDYCTLKLGYSESSACRRIYAARSLKDNPELAELFLSGKVTLCTISAASKSLKSKEIAVGEIVGKTKGEVQNLVARHQPQGKIRELVKPVFTESPKAEPSQSVKQEERYKLGFSVTKEVYEKFLDTKNRLSNSLGDKISIEGVFEKLLDLYLKPKTRRSVSAGVEKRYISRSVRREVFDRDGGQCSFVAPDGTRCCEKKYLQFDHIYPYALGGKSESSNLRLLCTAHNLLLAQMTFGDKASTRTLEKFN